MRNEKIKHTNASEECVSDRADIPDGMQITKSEFKAMDALNTELKGE